MGANGVNSSDLPDRCSTGKKETRISSKKNDNFRDFVNIDNDTANQFVEEYMMRNNKNKSKKPASNMMNLSNQFLFTNSTKIKSERL